MHSNLDPVSFQVLKHALWQITDEMGTSFIRVSGSPIVTEATDFDVGIFTKDGDVVTVGPYVTPHVPTMGLMLKEVLRRCQADPGICEGDMFIMNDPYLGACHQSDVALLSPFHFDGKLVAWTGVTAHESDIGAIEPGGFSPLAKEVYQEGLRLPPMRIVEGGRLRKDIFDALLNHVREPGLVGLNIRARIAANNVAQSRLKALCDKYGVRVFEAVMNDLIDFSEAKLRQRLLELPNGTYKHVDYVDFHFYPDRHLPEKKIYRVLCSMTKKADRLVFDFEGTSPQAPGFINCTQSGTLGGTFSSTCALLCYDIPWNQGIVRPVEVKAPEGTLVNPNPPAPCSMATICGMWVVRNTTTGAVSKMLSCSNKYWKEATAVWEGGFFSVVLNGKNQFGQPFTYMLLDPVAGGAGAGADRDGVDFGGEMYVPNPHIPNVETHELYSPTLFLFRRRAVDSGGPGKFRGGLAGEDAFAVYDTDRITMVLSGHGYEVPNASGIMGGLPGSTVLPIVHLQTKLREAFRSGHLPQYLVELEGEAKVLAPMLPSFSLGPMDVMFYRWQGGGGYGDPIDRDPELVLNDVQSQAVSEDQARRVYGVVIERESGKVLQNETASLRNAIRQERLSKSKTQKDGAWTNPHMHNIVILGRLGEYLQLVSDGSSNLVRCAKCNRFLCLHHENVKEYASILEEPLADVSLVLPKDSSFFLRQFFCPSCGTMFSTEIAQKNEPFLHDIQID